MAVGTLWIWTLRNAQMLGHYQWTFCRTTLKING